MVQTLGCTEAEAIAIPVRAIPVLPVFRSSPVVSSAPEQGQSGHAPKKEKRHE